MICLPPQFVPRIAESGVNISSELGISLGNVGAVILGGREFNEDQY